MIITNEMLTFTIERAYPEAVAWENVWVGFRTSGGTDTQLNDSEIMEWEVSGEPCPSKETLKTLVAEHMPAYQIYKNTSTKENLRSEALSFSSNPILWGELSEPEQQSLVEYYTALREVDVNTPVWPEKPTALT